MRPGPERLNPRYRRVSARAYRVEPVPFMVHRFAGSTSSCALCFGWRDDPRHWCDEVSTWNVLGWLCGWPHLPTRLPLHRDMAPVACRVGEAIRREAAMREDLRYWAEGASIRRAMVST